MRFKQILSAAMLCGISMLGCAGAAFTDTAGIPEQADIDYVVSHGLFNGTDEAHFSPSEPLSRAQAVAVLARQARVQGQPVDVFADVPADAYYRNPLGWAYQSGIVNGTSENTFAPDRPVTYRELTAILMRYLSWLGRTDTEIEPRGSGTVTRAQGASYFASLDRALLSRDTELLTHTAADGITLTGKLDLPAGSGLVERLVLFINGSGPNTYDNKRQYGGQTFNYFDLFAEQFGMRETGFFRWSTRGVSIGDQPPSFDTIDEAEYQTYLPSTSVSDIGEWITQLRQNPRLKDADIWLLGWSEGTIIAPLAAEAYPDEISGLLLAGYCNDRMDQIFDWQQSGEPSMIFYRQYFDTDGDGSISEAEYTADLYGVVSSILGNTPFADIDMDQNGTITANDFSMMLAPGKQAFYDAVERGDDNWLAENYSVRLTSGWFKAHQALQPNSEVLPTLDLPIHIFHGTADTNCNVQGVYDIRAQFAALGKTNLTTHVYEDYDHNLLYDLYVINGLMPTAFTDLFQSIFIL